MTRDNKDKKNSSVDMTEDEKDEKKILGRRIKEARLRAGYTQVQAATSLGIVEQAYQKYEYGKITPKIDMLIRIANMYKTTLDILFGRVIVDDSNATPPEDYVTYMYDCFALHRRRAGLTQRQVAERTGIPLRTYQSYEYGTSAPSSKYLGELARIFGLQIEQMFNPWKENPNRKFYKGEK